MLQLITLVIAVVVSTTSSLPTWDDLPVVDANLIAEVNRLGKWHADFNKQFYNMTIREARRLTGTFMESPNDALPYKPQGPKVALPETFDARQQWPNAIHPIRNQEQCGSCWAFGATEALSDRFAIQSNNSINVILSPQQLVSCDNKDGNMGCGGGYPIRAWQYMMNTGVVIDDCYPYTSGNGVTGDCLLGSSGCPSGTGSNEKYHAASAYSVSSDNIMQEIYENGPVEAAYMVYQDFYAYQQGVYEHVSGGLVGGHAVKIIGWGALNGTPYWLVANSWGTSWADYDGYFMIKRGVNECGIEGGIVAGLAKT